MENGWIDLFYLFNKVDYILVDIYGEWEVINDFCLNLVVMNLFDEVYIDYLSVGDYSEVFLSVIGL